ncbi:MAG: hypothetical protein ABL961_00655 [Vicinamibacterales bacterium]
MVNRAILSASAVALVLGTTGFSAEAAQSEGHARSRRGGGESRDSDSRRGDRRDNHDRQDNRRGSSERAQRDDRRDGHFRPELRGDDRRHFEFRRVPPRHYYGLGGNFRPYFGLGYGYRYGSPYSGRVYGYVDRPGYGLRRYYGDVRLLVRPRGAEVFVDGYYAGIVDDFDGVFQRLTLEAGPHNIEIAAPGLEPQFFDVYVDAARTVELHGDLLRDRRY